MLQVKRFEFYSKGEIKKKRNVTEEGREKVEKKGKTPSEQKDRISFALFRENCFVLLHPKITAHYINNGGRT